MRERLVMAGLVGALVMPTAAQALVHVCSMMGSVAMTGCDCAKRDARAPSASGLHDDHAHHGMHDKHSLERGVASHDEHAHQGSGHHAHHGLHHADPSQGSAASHDHAHHGAHDVRTSDKRFSPPPCCVVYGASGDHVMAGQTDFRLEQKTSASVLHVDATLWFHSQRGNCVDNLPSERAPPYRGPPLYKRHCSFLN